MEPSTLDGPALAPLLARVEARMAELVEGAACDVLAAIAREHLATGGKRLRARLALAACQALGGQAGAGVRWAAACELAHNATLIHDDLQDGDRLRRGQPTTWARHGMAQAINAGDLMLMLPVSGLCQGSAGSEAVGASLVGALSEAMVTVIRGQALECEMMRTHRVEGGLYADIIRQKTAALFELPVHGAALIAGQEAEAARQLAAAFAPLGMLFQLQDDVLDLFGDKGREAPGADLREGKVSALVVAHCRRHPSERAELVALLREPRASTDPQAVERFSQRFVEGGALAEVLGEMRQLRGAALAKVAAPLAAVMNELIERVYRPIAHLEAARAG